jgi:hypothetical protein
LAKPISKPWTFTTPPSKFDKYEIVAELETGIVVRYLTGPWKGKISTIRHDQLESRQQNSVY